MKNINTLYLSLEKELTKNKGYVITRRLFDAGLSSSDILNLCKNKKLIKVAHGLYRTPNTLEDELFIMQKRYPKIVYSYEISLYLHGLLNRAPYDISITVPRGKKVNLDVKIHYQVPKKYELGIISVKTSLGNLVKCYNLEKTICDVIKHKSLDLETQNYMFDQYFSHKDKDIDRLLKYAKLYKIFDVINAIVERSLYR